MNNAKKRMHLPVVFRQFLSLLFVVFLSQLMLQWFQNDLNVRLVYQFVFHWHTEKFLLSMLVMLLPALFLWALVGNVVITQVIYLLAASILGFATYEKMSQRGEPLYPADMTMIRDIGFLLEMLTPLQLVLGAIGVGASVILLIWLWRRNRNKKRDGLRRSSRLAVAFITSIAMVYVSNFQEEGNWLKQLYDRTAYWIPYSQQMNYYNNGFVAGFLYNFPSSPMKKPASYNKERMQQLVEKYKKKADAINESRSNETFAANVIFIMNESFANPHQLRESRKTFDPIPFTRELGKQQWGGKMLSQGFGGGTANIEFEALTGFSMEPFAPNVSTPFTQFLPKSEGFPSYVGRMKEEGHHATAIHPFDTSMYKRIDNYKILGFDDFFYDESMAHTERIGNNPFISDEAAYQEVLYRMEETENLDFVHLVTMQNHTPYSGKYDDVPSSRKTGFTNELVNQYYQDLLYSDAALEKLYQAVEESKEPTVVVLWGDHWPSVFGEESIGRNGVETFHQTPVVIFSNQETEAKNLQVISPFFFFNEVLKMTDTKVSPFDAFLLTLQEEIPAFEKGMYYLKDEQTFVASRKEFSNEAQKILEEYDWIMYDTTTGNKIAVQENFFTVNKEN